MKKFIILTLCTVFLFCSCAEDVQPDDYLESLRTPYSANATVNEDGTDYTVRIVLQQDGSLNIVFAEPAMLWGMGYSFEGDDSFLIYNDMSIELDIQELPTSSEGGVYRWHRLLECAGDFTVSSQNLNGEKAVKLTNGECEIFFDKETNSPLMIKSGGTVITFDEWNGKNTDDKTTDVSTN